MAIPNGGPLLSDRRAFLRAFAAQGLAGTLLPGALWAQLAAGAELTPETIACAEELAGIRLRPKHREQILGSLRTRRGVIERLREVPLGNELPPAVQFNPLPGGFVPPPPTRKTAPAVIRSGAPTARPTDLEELAFLPVTELAELIRLRRVTSLELTRMYLERLRRYDPELLAVVTLTEERALRQARGADAEIARGRYRGPLHGIPWGAKDLLAVRGYRTTWGVEVYRDRVIDEDATVVQRLDAAGAVLVAKLSLGELAWGDVWFGGMTRNPWRPQQGSSGSSAGPGAATAAGLVGFSIGSETLGSIASPSTVNGVTGLRPTFGRVPRTGSMVLSWSLDKLGPMCRSAEDCALVLDAIQGPDGRDASVIPAEYAWDPEVPLRRLRIGYFAEAFERQYPNRAFDRETLAVLRRLGADLRPVEMPRLPYQTVSLVLDAESAAAFDEFTRSGLVNRMRREDRWPRSFRAARFITAVDYINANRVRTLAIEAWAELFRDLDVIVAPTFGEQLSATNLTGHPALILPNGFRPNGTPVSITFVGALFSEAALLAVGRAYQQATDWNRRRPELTRRPG